MPAAICGNSGTEEAWRLVFSCHLSAVRKHAHTNPLVMLQFLQKHQNSFECLFFSLFFGASSGSFLLSRSD